MPTKQKWTIKQIVQPNLFNKFEHLQEKEDYTDTNTATVDTSNKEPNQTFTPNSKLVDTIHMCCHDFNPTNQVDITLHGNDLVDTNNTMPHLLHLASSINATVTMQTDLLEENHLQTSPYNETQPLKLTHILHQTFPASQPDLTSQHGLPAQPIWMSCLPLDSCGKQFIKRKISYRLPVGLDSRAGIKLENKVEVRESSREGVKQYDARPRTAWRYHVHLIAETMGFQDVTVMEDLHESG
ncbi:hypothetical protein LguiB_013621 [Lonicera macranthoides]